MGTCKNCGRECIRHAKGMCVTCYKKLVWKPKPYECKRCHRMLPHHAKGYCGGCYNTLFCLQQIKDRKNTKYHNISPEDYKKITQKCLICGFSDVVELHHLDKNRKNNSPSNMIGLCPNHHKMIHILKFKDKIKEQVKEALEKQEENPETTEENSSE